MRANQIEIQFSPETSISLRQNGSNILAVLKELFVLLEEYGPVWYTKEHHDRAIAVLLHRS
jgi:hypothetical protein